MQVKLLNRMERNYICNYRVNYYTEIVHENIYPVFEPRKCNISRLNSFQNNLVRQYIFGRLFILCKILNNNNLLYFEHRLVQTKIAMVNKLTIFTVVVLGMIVVELFADVEGQPQPTTILVAIGSTY